MARHAIQQHSRSFGAPARRRRTRTLARVLRVFGAVEEDEAGTVVLLLLNLFVLLFAYYLLKTAREPLILATGGAEMKSYAAAFQAAALFAFVPVYGWISSRLERTRLIAAMVLFFAAALEGFYLARFARVPYLGFAFYVWLGIFSNAAIALFWSYAGELLGSESGERLVPVIAVGAAAGPPVGSWVAERLFAGGMSPYDVVHLGALLLVVHLALYRSVERRTRGTQRVERPLRAGLGGFGLVMRSPYLRLVAVLLVLVNVVNTTGEYILGRSVVGAARLAASADPALDVTSYVAGFYARYYLWVNLASVVLQVFVASRLVKLRGRDAAVLALPIVALGVYAVVATGAAGLAAIAWAKGVENAVDYSVMNTGKQLLWLPVAGGEKYAAKQVIDGFFVRAGDLLAAGVVYAGTKFLGVGVAGFAALNLVLVVVWVATAWAVVDRYRASPAARREAAHPEIGGGGCSLA